MNCHPNCTNFCVYALHPLSRSITSCPDCYEYNYLGERCMKCEIERKRRNSADTIKQSDLDTIKEEEYELYECGHEGCSQDLCVYDQHLMKFTYLKREDFDSYNEFQRYQIAILRGAKPDDLNRDHWIKKRNKLTGMNNVTRSEPKNVPRERIPGFMLA